MAWMWRLHTREFYPQRDLKKYPVMFLNKSHSYPPFSPLFMWCWIFNEAHGVYYGCNETFTPGTRGHIMLDIDGCALENGLPIPDKKEIEQRKKQNREQLHCHKRCRSPRNKYGVHLAVSAPICGNATARFGNYYDISSVSSVASWEDVLMCKHFDTAIILLRIGGYYE